MANTYSIEALDPSQYQGAPGQITTYDFRVTRSGNVSASETIPWQVTGAVNITGAEFVGSGLPSGAVHFDPGQTSTAIAVNVRGGSVTGPDATFLVTLAAQNQFATGISDSASGGYGITRTDYVVSGGSGVVSLQYEMFSIPDRADLLLNGATIATTGGAVSGSSTLRYTSGAPTPIVNGDHVTVIISGYDPGTAWNYNITYNPGISQSVQAQAAILTGPSNAQWTSSTASNGSWTSASQPYIFDDVAGTWKQSGFSGVFDNFSFLASDAKYYLGVGKDTLVDLAGELATSQIENRIAADSPAAASIFAQGGQAITLYQALRAFVDDSFQLIDQGADAIFGKNNMTPAEFDARATEIATTLQRDLVLTAINVPLVSPIVKGVQRILSHSDMSFQVHLGSDAVAGATGHQYTMLGGENSDNFQGAGLGDILWGGAGNDTLAGNAGSDQIFGGEGNDTLTGGTDNDYLDGGGGNNTISGEVGDDTIVGGFGVSTLRGGIGNDTYVLYTASDQVLENFGEGTDLIRTGVSWSSLPANVEDLTLTGSAAVNAVGNTGNNTLTGNDADNTLDGGAGNDILDGGSGSDFLTGGTGDDIMVGRTGDDIYVVDSAADVISEVPGQGRDRVLTTVTLTLSANVEEATATGLLSINLTGNGLDNLLTGNNADNVLDGQAGNDVLDSGVGNDVLDGGAGADVMLGRAGNDIYVVDNAGDIIRENANEGADSVRSSVSVALSANVEDLVLTGSAAVDGTGNSAANSLSGNAADNVLDGGGGDDVLDGGAGNDFLVGAAGNDRMFGRAGNDVYVLDSAGDAITENPGEGADLVRAPFTYALPLNFEDLTLIGSGAIGGTGNATSNFLSGNDGDNTLDGADGNDILDGGAGNDFLIGGTGGDAMLGRTGNDTFLVDNASDSVRENPSEGIDIVRASVNYALPENVEDLTLEGTALNGTGNSLSNFVTGNTQDNVLDAGAGSDILDGGLGNDFLDGGVGLDVMIGRAGNDTYVVDIASDSVRENLNEGTDLIRTAISFVLPDNVEDLLLIGTGETNGTGNALSNTLTGNGANNTLDGGSGNDILDGGAGHDTLIGGSGNDTMVGRAGDDTYVVDSPSDVVVENAGEGADTILSGISVTLPANIEDLILTGIASAAATGNTLSNRLTGNTANNVLSGAAGDDILDGGLGSDTMSGGTGNDLYVVDSTGDVVTENAGEGTDTIRTMVSFTLPANVENLGLLGVSAINATGNVLTNSITGNGGDNVLDAGAGNDVLDGDAGDDFLIGGAGDDVMFGRAGNDTYLVDSAGDVVIENPGGGRDLVRSSVSFILGANVDDLTLGGALAINGTGNDLDNILSGNGANNTFNGGAGNDTLVGGLGRDTAVYSQSISQAGVSRTATGYTVATSAGTDSLQSIERILFSDGRMDLGQVPKSDFSGDGKTDMVLRNSATGTFDILQMDGPRHSAFSEYAWGPAWQIAATQADFNGDLRSDMVLRNATTGAITVLQLNGSAYSGFQEYAWGPASQVSSAQADFNGDGKTDLVLRSSATGTITVLQMNGPAYSAYQDYAWGTATNVAAAGGDFNGDGRSDLVLQNATTGTITVLQMNGPVYSSFQEYARGPGWQVVETKADFNGDGKSDMVLRNSTSGTISVLQMNGAASSASQDYAWGAAWEVVDAKGDFNGDGKSDLVLQNTTTGAFSILQMNGPVYSAFQEYAWGSAWRVVDTKGDFNGDGKTDLVVRNGTTGAIDVLEMNGPAISGWHEYAWGTAWRVAETRSDFNGDNKSDLVLRNATTGAVDVLQMDGPSYTDFHEYAFGSPWQVADAVSDFNADGKSDLVLRNDTTGAVDLLQMNGPIYSAFNEYAWGGDWQLVA